MEELERHDRETSTLLSVSQAVSQSLQLEQIIDSALEKVSQTMAPSAVYVHLFENGRLILKRYHGFTPETEEAIDSVPIGEGVIGEILRTAQPVVVESLPLATGRDGLACLAEGRWSLRWHSIDNYGGDHRGDGNCFLLKPLSCS